LSNLREHSKQNWRSQGCLEQINAGSLQRIADAAELIADNYQRLLDDVKRYKEYHHGNLNRINNLNHRIAGFKAVITRLKNGKKKA